MTTEELTEMRRLLEKTREQLAETDGVSRQSTKTEKLDQCAVGRLSRMDAMQAREMAVETERRRQEKLKAIEAALKRIESGDFGDCRGCDEQIDIRRLRFDPSARYCIRCAQ